MHTFLPGIQDSLFFLSQYWFACMV